MAGWLRCVASCGIVSLASVSRHVWCCKHSQTIMCIYFIIRRPTGNKCSGHPTRLALVTPGDVANSPTPVYVCMGYCKGSSAEKEKGEKGRDLLLAGSLCAFPLLSLVDRHWHWNLLRGKKLSQAEILILHPSRTTQDHRHVLVCLLHGVLEQRSSPTCIISTAGLGDLHQCTHALAPLPSRSPSSSRLVY